MWCGSREISANGPLIQNINSLQGYIEPNNTSIKTGIVQGNKPKIVFLKLGQRPCIGNWKVGE